MIATILTVGLILFVIVCTVYPKFSRVQDMSGSIAVGRLVPAEGSIKTVLHGQIEESQQELAQRVSNVVPLERQADLCGVIEGYTPTMMNLARDKIIGRQQ